MANFLLIDDDSALTHTLVHRAFPAPAHTVSVAKTGAEGVRSVRANLPDVVLLNMSLPDQSGLDIQQAIQRIDARIPVVFVTEATTADSAIDAMQQGAYYYL